MPDLRKKGVNVNLGSLDRRGVPLITRRWVPLVSRARATITCDAVHEVNIASEELFKQPLHF